MKKNIGSGAKDIAAAVAAVAMVLYAVLSARSAGAAGQDPAAVGSALGFASLMPTVLTVFLAFVYKNVILSLAAGMILGGLMYSVVLGRSAAGVVGLTCSGIVETVSDRDNAEILVLCLAIGGMVEVIRMTGGFETLARRLTKRVNTPRKVNIVGELLGIFVFFDDYANSLIVGPVMRPLTDKLKISREKLAYIVDSTAAPVTGIAPISSWVAVEVAVISEGLANAGAGGSGYSLFLAAIPFCFYCIFCLLFIFISSITQRELGPMYAAECRARGGETLRRDSLPDREQGAGSDVGSASLWTAVLPVAALIVFALVRFYLSGKANALDAGIITGREPFGLPLLSACFAQANTIFIVFEAAIVGTVTAVGLGLIEKVFTVREAMGAFVRGCSQILETDMILVFAWTLSSFVNSLGAVHYTVGLITANVAWWLIPVLVFTVCCVISFAAGSYGCMFIALPMAIPIALNMIQTNPAIPANYLPLVIGGGLAGAIFGDHCSPITDCTILSSEGSGCNNFDHVRTQLPYALITAAVSIFIGILPATFGLPAWACILIGICVFTAILLIFGKIPGPLKQKEQLQDEL